MAATSKLNLLSGVLAVSSTLFCITLLFAGFHLQNELNNLQKLVKKSNKENIINVASFLQKRSADSDSATGILANALNELIEKKLYTLMECNRDELDNKTDCSLKPGPKGEKGCTGDQGKDGPKGPPGNPGVKGEKGHYGFPGHKGEIGPQGEPGDKGQKGFYGFPGHKGEMGPRGPAGERGLKGDPGTVGARGLQGPAGSPGLPGPAGEQGNTGEKGERGYPGVKGDAGSKGGRGVRGRVGPRGEPGYPGNRGEQGQKGEKGQNGELVSPDGCPGNYWRRVAFLNMSDPQQNCPTGLIETGYSIRSCGRVSTGGYSCDSVVFPVRDGQYREVCGRATAYQWGQNYAFYGYHLRRQNINGEYVDGLSITHGTPRQHIWSYASGLFSGSSGDSYPDFRCPCDPGNTYGSPSFVGNDYYCDTVANEDNWGSQDGGRGFWPNNALWDGKNSLNSCYNHNSPPWFNKRLASNTVNDIEVRACFTDPKSTSNIALTNLEIYVR